MTVSRTMSFIVGLSLPGLIAFAALGEDIPVTNLGGSGIVADLASPGATEMVKLRDISARLYRVEMLLREMCARTARFAGCEELRQQQ